MLDGKTKSIEGSVAGGQKNLAVARRKAAAADCRGDLAAAVPKLLSGGAVKGVEHRRGSGRCREDDAVDYDRRERRSRIARRPAGLERGAAICAGHFPGDYRARGRAQNPAAAGAVLPASQRADGRAAWRRAGERRGKSSGVENVNPPVLSGGGDPGLLAVLEENRRGGKRLSGPVGLLALERFRLEGDQLAAGGGGVDRTIGTHREAVSAGDGAGIGAEGGELLRFEIERDQFAGRS